MSGISRQKSPYAFTEDDMCVPVSRRFEQIADLLADKPAVAKGDRSLSYGELNAAANTIAAAILDDPDLGDAPVSILMENDVGIITAILGVLKSGKAYSALNPMFPEKHNKFIVEDLGSKLLLADSISMDQARQSAGGSRLVINVESLAKSGNTANPSNNTAISDLAAVFYTSGTTGAPKGVMRTQANLLHRSLIAEHISPVRPDDIVSMLYPCSVGASTSDLYVSLFGGATLQMFEVQKSGPDGLAAWLIENKVTRLHLHTAILRQLLDGLPASAYFPYIRYVRPSDRLYYRDVRRLRRHVPENTVIAHGLASSEAGNVTLFALDGKLGADEELVPVGYPVPGVQITLVDENGAAVPPGVRGEIVARGLSVASGYWRRPELTAKKFLRDSPTDQRQSVKMGDIGRLRADGALELVGRVDQMVKIRGHRVEIGLVERTIERLPDVSRAAVVVHEDRFGDRTLVAFVRPTKLRETSIIDMRARLQKVLADPMIPDRFIWVESLPILPNGKVNYRDLPAPGRERSDLVAPFVAPRTPIEADIAAVWADVLGLDQVGIHDRFLDLGGHSLLAARIVSRILRSYRVDLPPSTLFEQPTVADMALVLAQLQAAQIDRDELDRLLAELSDE